MEFFRAMARFHVRATPPTSPLLFEYGRGFPAFIEGYEHAQGMPWLAHSVIVWVGDFAGAVDEKLLNSASIPLHI